MKMLLNFDKFLPRHAPFVEHKYGAAWFIEDFPAFDPDNEDEVNEVWRAYLEQTVLSCKIGANANQYGLVGYSLIALLGNLACPRSGQKAFLKSKIEWC
jgi:hypothetical protein